MKPTAQSESLSALLDGELSEIELKRLLRDLDNEQAGRFADWQLARDLLHGQPVAAVPAQFNEHLAAQLHDQQSLPLGQRLGPSLARLAVAASVALAVVIGWQYHQDDSALPRLAEQRPLLLGEGELVSGRLSTVPEQPVADRQPALDDLIVRHTEFAARHGGQGVAPYIRFVSMEAARSEQQ